MPANTAKTFIIALLPGWFVAYFSACIFHTQQVLGELSALGVTITTKDRLTTMLYDLWGLLPLYGSGIFVTMLIAMVVAAAMTAQFRRRQLLVPIAGALGMLVMLAAMYPIMHVTMIAGARSLSGLLLQCLAGFVGGAAFLLIFRYKRHWQQAG